ncbi:hypothetical protein TNCV_4021651 [Trichonephila clavipes]|nr:hypothetical protein TNCV_4021651 [Trichonephila clavipes]
MEIKTFNPELLKKCLHGGIQNPNKRVRLRTQTRRCISKLNASNESLRSEQFQAMELAIFNYDQFMRTTCRMIRYQTDKCAEFVGGTETIRIHKGMQDRKCCRCKLCCKEAEKKSSNLLMGQKTLY